MKDWQDEFDAWIAISDPKFINYIKDNQRKQLIHEIEGMVVTPYDKKMKDHPIVMSQGQQLAITDGYNLALDDVIKKLEEK